MMWWCWGAPKWARQVGGARAVKAGPEGRPQGSLDGPVSWFHIIESEARQGFVVGLAWGGSEGLRVRTRACRLQVPCNFGWGRPGTGCRTFLRRAVASMERCGRSQAGSIKWATSPVGVMSVGGLALWLRPVRGHPASWATQRISPSRSP